MNIMQSRPGVGVAVIVYHNKHILFGKRKGSHGAGSRNFPGGHLEMYESIEECALREVYEETGLKIKNIKLGPYTNDIFTQENKHYVTVFVIADYDSGSLELKEPEKCECRERYQADRLPSPLFLPIANLLKNGFAL